MSKRKDLEGMFEGGHFDVEIIVLCVRWYLCYETVQECRDHDFMH